MSEKAGYLGWKKKIEAVREARSDKIVIFSMLTFDICRLPYFVRRL